MPLQNRSVPDRAIILFAQKLTKAACKTQKNKKGLINYQALRFYQNLNVNPTPNDSINCNPGLLTPVSGSLILVSLS